MRLGDKYTVVTLQLFLGNYQSLLIFSKVILETRWINFNVVYNISYFDLPFSVSSRILGGVLGLRMSRDFNRDFSMCWEVKETPYVKEV